MAKLNNIIIQASKPKAKLYKLIDGNGLCLLIRPTGKKVWRFDYTDPKTKKRNSLTLGQFPDITLAQARQISKEKRLLLNSNLDLFLEEKRLTTNEREPQQTLNDVFPLWLERWKDTVSIQYANQVERALHANILSIIGKMALDDIKPKHIVGALSPMEARGSLVYLRRTKQALGLIFDFAISRGICEYNPVAMVKNNAFKTPEKKHFDALKPEELPHFIKTLVNSDIQDITKSCILFQLLTMTRPAETTNSEWAEIDLEERIWTIPAERMKMDKEHVIPLSTAAIEILNKMHPITYNRKYVFTGRNMVDAINRETPRVALRRLKPYGVDTSAHGLRALASTYLNETGLFRSEVIEMALAHTEKNKIRAAYNRAEYLKERREMLEWWGNEIIKHI